MSLILEALRKSEAERRRGQAPDLLTDTIPNVPARQTRSRDMRAIALVTGAALVAALLLVAWLRRDETPPASALGPEEVALSARAAVAPPGPLQPPRRQASAPRREPPPATPAHDAVVRSAAPARASSAAVEASTDVSDVELPPPPPPIAAAPAAAPVTPSAATFASPDMPLRLSDLSAEERQQLPALKVSMHMWAPDAANRFAIIDGTRVNEGDRVGDAAVEAIQQDAVMLAWRGRRIRLPIR